MTDAAGYGLAPAPLTDATVSAAVRGVRRVTPRAVAFRRGPWPYGLEAAARERPATDGQAAADVGWEAIAAPERPGGSVTLAGRSRASSFAALPYPLWLHRGSGPMAVRRAQP